MVWLRWLLALVVLCAVDGPEPVMAAPQDALESFAPGEEVVHLAVPRPAPRVEAPERRPALAMPGCAADTGPRPGVPGVSPRLRQARVAARKIPSPTAALSSPASTDDPASR